MVRARLAAQLLAGPPAGSVVEVARRLLAVQAQDQRGFRLAVRARTRGLGAADVERALTEERSVVVSWLNRGTLHLVAVEDYRWLHALTTPPLFTMNARRLRQEGVSPDQAERGVQVIVGAVTDQGPQTRDQLRDRLRSAGVPVAGQALVHLLMRASLLGHVVRGPMVADRHHAYVLVREWLGAVPAPIARDLALCQLARGYLAGHGPATDRDLARWSGLPLRDARQGLRALGPDLDERESGLVDLVSRDRYDVDLPPPRLLGPYEPLLLGWTSREPILGEHHRHLVTANGLFRPFALVRGRGLATWRLVHRRVVLEPFSPLPPGDREALERDARDVERFLAAPPA